MKQMSTSIHVQSFSATAQAIGAASVTSEDEFREPRSLEECVKIKNGLKGASELTDDELVMLVREKV